MKLALRFVCLFALILVVGTALAEETPRAQAWRELNSGLTNSNADKRVKAVRELALLTRIRRRKSRHHCLEGPEARGARGCGAVARRYGRPNARAALWEMRDDTEPAVILSAGHSLIVLGDDRGYGVFYAVVAEKTGEQKTGTSLTEEKQQRKKKKKKYICSRNLQKKKKNGSPF